MKWILAFLVLLTACSPASAPTGSAVDDSGFRELCESNGHMWMTMESEGSGQLCTGCMEWGGPHLCSMEEYEDYLEHKGSARGAMPGMNHDAMTAHAGFAESVDVHEYHVSFDRSGAVGVPTELKVTITDKAGKAITDLDIVHERPMHVILVRDDLHFFDHIHPELDGDAWVVPYSFLAGGNYRVWVDFTIDGMTHLADFDLAVAGARDAAEPDTLGELRTQVQAQALPTAGTLMDLEYDVRARDDHDVKITERFLGASAHLVIISSDLQTFAHMHDDADDGDSRFQFQHVFDDPGIYGTWLQFRYDGEPRTSRIEIDVRP